MTEVELDALLVNWLSGGPTLAHDRVTQRALLAVADVPQDGTAIRSIYRAFRRAPLLWTAAAAGMLALAIGLFVAQALVGDKPSPTPDPSLPETSLFSSKEAGYELLIPTSWSEVDSGFPDARHWVGSDGELMISYGSSIFDGGRVTLCMPPLGDRDYCVRTEHGYSIPLQPSDHEGSLRLEGYLDQCDGGCPITSTTAQLGPEPAGEDRLVMRGRQLTYVSGFHDFRPIILVWSEPATDPDPALVQHMLESFHFLDPGPEASVAPIVDPTRLVTMVDEEAGYQILMPQAWSEDARPFLDGAEPYPGVRRFGADGASSGIQALTISVGTSDGSLYLCQVLCRNVVVASLDQLDDAIVSVPTEYEDAVEGEKHGELLLGTDIGRFEKPGYNNPADIPYGLGPISQGTANCLGCPWMLYHAYVIHNGRPVVLAFDFWNIAFERISVDYVVRMLESFRWLDEPAATGTFPEAGFSMRLPPLWNVVLPSEPRDPNVIYFEKGARSGDALFSLTVIAGGEDGSVRTCMTPRVWEVCQQPAPASLQELALATHAELHTHALGLAPAVAVQDGTVDGEPAVQVGIDAFTSKECCLFMIVPEHADYVVAIHHGRPYVLRFLTIIGTAPEDWFDELLAGFHFLA